MKASFLLDLCLENKIDFFTGVPDSQLKGLCEELCARYGVSGSSHMVAHNEGGAVGLCAGHYLASGRPALCYMQNSGLGNAVNPLASLMDVKAYALPCLLVVGWRGEPGVHDEPQHARQGEITLDQLRILDIPYFVLSPDTTDEAFRKDFDAILNCLSSGRCAAIVVRRGALTGPSLPAENQEKMIPREVSASQKNLISREAAAELILSGSDASDVFVSTTGKLSREIFEIRERNVQDHSRDFLTIGSMGHASMIALRIAMEQPERRVWCLDGDGALLMHLGASAIISQAAPKNLIHVVFNNGTHESVGGMPVCCGNLPIGALARAAGYRSVYRAENGDDLSALIKEAMKQPGPIMLEVLCANGARADLGRPTQSPIQNRDAFMSNLGSL